jgi:hypothetical protein
MEVLEIKDHELAFSHWLLGIFATFTPALVAAGMSTPSKPVPNCMINLRFRALEITDSVIFPMNGTTTSASTKQMRKTSEDLFPSNLLIFLPDYHKNIVERSDEMVQIVSILLYIQSY